MIGDPLRLFVAGEKAVLIRAIGGVPRFDLIDLQNLPEGARSLEFRLFNGGDLDGKVWIDNIRYTEIVIPDGDGVPDDVDNCPQV